MKNPWIKLKGKTSYVLDEDKEAITAFNKKHKGTDYEIKLDQPPAPFVGDLNAPIILLNANPGYKKEDKELYDDKNFLEAAQDNLMHKWEEYYPFYFLDGALGKNSGFVWWNQKLKEPICYAGIETVAKKIFVIEYFPYHSVKFRAGFSIPSQSYAKYLVEKAMKRKSFIVVMRGEKLWLGLVPSLKRYKYHTLDSWQNVAISRKNLRGNFDILLKKLKTNGRSAR